MLALTCALSVGYGGASLYRQAIAGVCVSHRFQSSAVDRMAQALGGRGPARQFQRPPDYEIVMVEDPLYRIQEVREQLEAQDPLKDRVNRLANEAEGPGVDPDGKEVWSGRRCCWLTVGRFLADLRTHRPPIRRTCPACTRVWECRVNPAVYRNGAEVHRG